MITAIEPSNVKPERAKQQKPGTSITFDQAVSAAGPAVASGVGVATQSYQPAALTAATMTGIAGSYGSFANTPYVSSTPISAASGYSYGGLPNGGAYTGAGVGAGIGVPGYSTGVGVTTGAPSQDYLEKQALFQQMNDANWEMLMAQITVNEIAKNYQAASNTLKTKSDTELNAVRNFRS